MEIPVGQAIKRNRLIVLTPQILIDELRRPLSYISFNNISMMIFDECHKTTKKHPYKIIMDMLMDFLHDNPDSKMQVALCCRLLISFGLLFPIGRSPYPWTHSYFSISNRYLLPCIYLYYLWIYDLIDFQNFNSYNCFVIFSKRLLALLLRLVLEKERQERRSWITW